VRDRWDNRWRDRWRDRDFDWDDFPFFVGWWGGHGFHHGHGWNFWGHSHYRPWYWWTWTPAPRLYGWFDYGWSTPYYWDYGPGEYIYYDDGAIYVNNEYYQPAPVFYEETVRIVESAPELTEEQAAQKEWLPLGVFAVTPEGQAEIEVLCQLAVTNDGIIGGTAYDQQSDAAFAIEGTVDKDTQRAVWSFTDASNRRIVMETSIFNLTQDEATGLVHYSPDNIRVVELVRLEPPEEAAVTADASVETELPAPPQ
jgi:hypothetical protein